MTFLYYSFCIGLGLFMLAFGIASLGGAIRFVLYVLNDSTGEIVDFLTFWKYRRDSLELPPISDENQWQ